jgi:DNA-binding MarR family transcriptional regulator
MSEMRTKTPAKTKITKGANGKPPSTHDRESSASERDHTSLRLWLRLLTCTTLIENNIRGLLREEFSTTLPRFDLMAQLARHPEGLKMGELSRLMMVSGGNVTGITDQLEKDGLVERLTLPGDRRAWKVRLTDAGRETFDSMAVAHETWIVELMDSLTAEEQQQLHAALGKLKQGLRGK